MLFLCLFKLKEYLSVSDIQFKDVTLCSEKFDVHLHYCLTFCFGHEVVVAVIIGHLVS